MHLREKIIIVKQEKRMAELFGHSNNFATLSLSLRYPPTITLPLYTARAGVYIYGFSCNHAREAVAFFSINQQKTNKTNTT